MLLLLFIVALAAPAVVGFGALNRARQNPVRDQAPPNLIAEPRSAPLEDPPEDLTADEERVGIILVHGIGEQRRFEHLAGQSRDIIKALREQRFLGMQVDAVSVDISPHGAAAFQAAQDTWNTGPDASVTIMVDHHVNGRQARTRLLLHEVWWADVNEPYSIAKQFRFWLWGLAVWAHPAKMASALGSASRVAPPVVPDRSQARDRLRLWMIGCFFVLLGYSIGAFSFLFTRLFATQPPEILRTMANYISAVKLYNQERRFGPGLWWAREEFLDSVNEPPRVSVRRRMIRAIADVACNRYHRWYVLAHSQGSVVAFNGLMETAYAWPGYLDEKRWLRLKRSGLAGRGGQGMEIPTGTIVPRRPGWVGADEIAYRSRIFGRLRGFLTYGSPVEKFAGIWPALVPINRERTFRPDVPWLNIYDPLDPVSGKHLAFQSQPPECCPRAVDLGYAASWWLLLAHLKYLTIRKPRSNLAMLATRWILKDDVNEVVGHATTGKAPGEWFASGGEQERFRCRIAWLTWILAALALTLLGAIVVPLIWHAVVAACSGIWSTIVDVTMGGTP
jgi:hypothetical protein